MTSEQQTSVIMWAVPILLAVIGFAVTLGINLIVARLKEISTLLHELQRDFKGHERDIQHLQQAVDRIDKINDYHESRIRDLETHLPREKMSHR